MAKKDDRFAVVHEEGNRFTGRVRAILVDRVTGVNYLWVKEGYGAGLTPLLGADGKPVITYDVE